MRRIETIAPAAALLAALLVPERAAAQLDSALLSKLSFNLTNPGGKSLAMGGAFTAIADDATAALANPAGLGQLSSVEMGISVKRFDERIGLVTARSTATGSLTAPWGAITPSDSQISLQSTNLEYGGIVLPISRYVVVALSYAENLSFEGSADAGGYQYLEYRDNRSGGVTRRDYLYEYREFGAVSLRNRLVGLSAAYRLTDRIRIGAGVTLNRTIFELEGDDAGPHRIVSRTYLSPVSQDIRTVTMNVEGFGGTKPAFIAGLHADLDARGTVSIGASYSSAARTNGTLVIGGDVPASLVGQERRPFSFAVPSTFAGGIAVRPFAGMTIAAEAQWVGYAGVWSDQLPVVSYSGLVGPSPGVYVDSALASVSSPSSAWVPRVGVEYIAAAGTTRVAFRLGWHREPKRGTTEQLAVNDSAGNSFPMNDPPFSGGVATVFDGGSAENRYSGGLGLTLGSALSLDAAFDVGLSAQRFSASLFWRF
ncbi:MAG: OmpP1/FadL family transporter [Thermoanaerobaculia bacterium]